MLTAITRAVSPAIDSCELEFSERRPIDFEKADAQHLAYEAYLVELGLKVISLAREPDLPDSVFVEDPAVVLDEVAVITRMGPESRRAEAESLADALSAFRPLVRISAPATLEGGDVMRIGRTLYVGQSTRTNADGVAQLRRESEPFGYQIVPVPVHGCLHLKSACTYLSEGVVLANRAWIDMAPLREYRIIDVPPEEPGAGNTLTIDGTVLVASAFPKTAAILEGAGYRVRTLDISELVKAEAGVTCCSLIFET